MLLTPPTEKCGLGRAPDTLKPPPWVPAEEGRTPGVSRAKSKYWRAFNGMPDITWLSIYVA